MLCCTVLVLDLDVEESFAVSSEIGALGNSLVAYTLSSQLLSGK